MTSDVLLNGYGQAKVLTTADPGIKRQAHKFKTLPLGIGTPNCQFWEFPEMCGICGNVAFPSLRSSDAAHRRVKTTLRSLSHRGPDATGQVDTDVAVLGATRVAIRGLTKRLSQSVADQESGAIAVCTGEIDKTLKAGFSPVWGFAEGLRATIAFFKEEPIVIERSR